MFAAYQSTLLHMPPQKWAYPLLGALHPTSERFKVTVLTFSFTKGEMRTMKLTPAQVAPTLPCSSPRVPPQLQLCSSKSTIPRSLPGKGLPPHQKRPPQDYRTMTLRTGKTTRPQSFASSLPAITLFMRQPAQKQQLRTPTGLTEVKTHHALLFRQTQITASSADCSRDEQTHINYRLNFTIHLSKARNISKTALITLTNPSPADGATRETKAFRKKRKKKKAHKTFSLLFPYCYPPPKNTHSKPRRARGIKITSESSRGSQNLALRLRRQTAGHLRATAKVYLQPPALNTVSVSPGQVPVFQSNFFLLWPSLALQTKRYQNKSSPASLGKQGGGYLPSSIPASPP